MPIEVTMPKLSPTMESGVITQWMVKVGDAVTTLDSLRGLEGTAAARYFRCFARMAPSDIGFENRIDAL